MSHRTKGCSTTLLSKIIMIFINGNRGVDCMKPGEIVNKGIDERYFEFLCQRWYAPVHRTLDMKLSYLGNGVAGVRMAIGPEYTTIRGRLHGGIISTLVDTSMGWAILAQGWSCVTIDLYTNFLTSAFEGNELIAEGKVVYTANRIAVADCTLYDDKGTLVATSRGTFSIKQMDRKYFE